ncbi:PAS domain S-box protein [Spirulina sp. CCNP1310]|uniref:PAS domain S-box protein n=1 Tax=Spirulina sp. CCNP1310 TaxID=3110249 RepID=UPI002B207F24|nr:PAS domain S-box protein [Spirulina sp. CCNP1310]MEA5417664.1 PAS domain S-box protein [Spirulina sp. CCNP1310]
MQNRTSAPISLRLFLIAPLLAQIIVVVGTTAYLSLHNGQRTVDQMAQELVKNMGDRTKSEINQQLNLPELLSQSYIDSYRAGQLQFNQLTQLEQFFAQQLKSQTTVTALSYATTGGDFVGVERVSDRSLLLKRRNPETGANRHLYRLSWDALEETTILNPYSNRYIAAEPYDPRQTPWYQLTTSKHRAIWSPAYVDKRRLKAGVSQPIYDQDHNLMGVLNLELSLNQFSYMLSQLTLSRQGIIVLTDQDGYLIATSEQESLYHNNQRLKAVHSQNPVIAASAMEHGHGNFNNFQVFQSKINEKKYYIYRTDLKNNLDIHWVLTIAVPEALFTAPLAATRNKTLVLCAIALFMATGMGIWTTRVISRPLLHLLTTSQRLAEGDFAARNTIRPSRIQELNLLMEASVAMGTKIQETLAALHAQQENLESYIQDRDSLFEAIFENAGIGIGLTNLEGYIIDSNPALQRLLGYSNTELQQLHFSEYTYPEDLDADVDKVIEIIEGKRDNFSMEKRYIRKDKSIVWARMTLCSIRKEGELLYTFCMTEDITEWKQSDAQNKAMFTVFPDLIFRMDQEGTYLSYNSAASMDALVTQGDRLGKKLHDILPEEVANRHLYFIQEAIASGTVQCYEQEITINGRTQFEEVRIARSGHDEVIMIIRDISDRKRTEIFLQQAMEAAQAASQAKTQFLANMSHELRTPLNAILGFTQVMARDSRLDGEQQGQIQIINRSGEHLLGLINSILDLSKIEAGQMQLQPTSFDLHHLCYDLTDLLISKAQVKGISLECSYDSDVPVLLYGDGGKLRQVLINLIGNAIKFTDQGGVMLHISNLAPEENPYRLQFTVSDTGAGIAQEEMHALFQAFAQTESGLKSQSGTGLGLAISQKFIALMGGNLEVESTLGEGSRFFFTLTLPPGDAADVVIATQSLPVVGLAPNQKTYRILVVDDRWENSHLVDKLLSSVGFEVKTASNGAEGIEVWREWEPDLIWMDMRMPIMDGYEATTQIKATPQGRKTVVIALTASAFEEQRSQVLAAGCDDFVRKPFREAVLFDKMAEYLGVEYIYGETGATTEVQIGEVATLAELQGYLLNMPKTWQEDLLTATMAANSNQILELCEHLPLEADPLREMIQQWLDGFRFDALEGFLESVVDEANTIG